VNPPPLTLGLIERLERAASWKNLEGLRRASQQPGNPLGVHVLEDNGLIGYIVESTPDLPWYNAISGLSDHNLAYLPAMLELFERWGVTPRVTLWATQVSARVGVTLHELGFAVQGVTNTLYAVPVQPEIVPVSGVQVRELEAGEAVESFNAVLLEGYGFTCEAQRQLTVLENELPNTQRYLASVDGIPAAAGALVTHDGIAYLAGAATIPQARGRGAQSALIRQRLSDAASNAELVVVTTAFASQSQHNLERHGFRVAHTKTNWVNPRAASRGPSHTPPDASAA
jgi:ribosomal protein S18 acetylase RimI-like enzyme